MVKKRSAMNNLRRRLDADQAILSRGADIDHGLSSLKEVAGAIRQMDSRDRRRFWRRLRLRLQELRGPYD